jgi:hypothetical protein
MTVNILYIDKISNISYYMYYLVNIDKKDAKLFKLIMHSTA